MSAERVSRHAVCPWDSLLLRQGGGLAVQGPGQGWVFFPLIKTPFHNLLVYLITNWCWKRKKTHAGSKAAHLARGAEHKLCVSRRTSAAAWLWSTRTPHPPRKTNSFGRPQSRTCSSEESCGSPLSPGTQQSGRGMQRTERGGSGKLCSIPSLRATPVLSLVQLWSESLMPVSRLLQRPLTASALGPTRPRHRVSVSTVTAQDPPALLLASAQPPAQRLNPCGTGMFLLVAARWVLGLDPSAASCSALLSTAPSRAGGDRCFLLWDFLQQAAFLLTSETTTS